MEIDKETQNKIQELQVTEQNLQTFLLEKQAFQLELSEVTSAIKEVKGTKQDVYKIVGQIMVNTEKQKLLKELEEKKDTLNIRIKTIEKQEEAMKKKMSSLQKEIEEKFSPKK